MEQIGELDLDTVIWRYLTFQKFVCLIRLNAVWFAKLGIFEEAEEGITPKLTRQDLKGQHRDMEEWCPDEGRNHQPVVRSLHLVPDLGREIQVDHISPLRGVGHRISFPIGPSSGQSERCSVRS